MAHSKVRDGYPLRYSATVGACRSEFIRDPIDRSAAGGRVAAGVSPAGSQTHRRDACGYGSAGGLALPRVLGVQWRRSRCWRSWCSQSRRPRFAI